MFSFLKVTDREGSVEAEVSGVELELYCVLHTNRTLRDGQNQANINISHFSASDAFLSLVREQLCHRRSTS